VRTQSASPVAARSGDGSLGPSQQFVSYTQPSEATVDDQPVNVTRLVVAPAPDDWILPKDGHGPDERVVVAEEPDSVLTHELLDPGDGQLSWSPLHDATIDEPRCGVIAKTHDVSHDAERCAADRAAAQACLDGASHEVVVVEPPSHAAIVSVARHAPQACIA
jgi:hypothetical protein